MSDYTTRDRKSEYNRRYRAKNRARLNAENAVYRAANPRRIRNNNLKRTGFTLELFEAQVEEQGGLCAICAVDLASLPQKHVHADHCHNTGQPRGVLCHACNTGIGSLQDSPRLLLRAFVYLVTRRRKSNGN